MGGAGTSPSEGGLDLSTNSDFLLAFGGGFLVEWPTLPVIAPTSDHRSFRHRRPERTLLAQAYRLGREAVAVSYTREVASAWAPSQIYGAADHVVAPAARSRRQVSALPSCRANVSSKIRCRVSPIRPAVTAAPVESSGTGEGEPGIDEGDDSEPGAGRKARLHQRGSRRLLAAVVGGHNPLFCDKSNLAVLTPGCIGFALDLNSGPFLLQLSSNPISAR